MGRYLMVTWDGAGNLVSTLGIAWQLVANGHDVRVQGHPSIDARCGSHGWRFVPLSRTGEFDNTAANEPADEMATLTHQLWFSPAVAADVHAELEREPADVVIADCMLMGALCAGQAAGVPTVALFHSPFSLFRAGPLVELLAPGLPLLHDMRRDLGLPPVSSIADVHDACALSLVATPREYDVDIPVPSNVHFVGPILDGPPLVAEHDGLDAGRPGDHRPLVVVSFSTSFQGQHDALQRVADALGSLPVRAVITTGPAVDPGTVRAAGNTEVVGFVPHDQLLTDASVVVTHAGLGTVMAALAHGVPLVCAPMGRDQFFNAAMVDRLGAGVVVDAAPDASTLAAAIDDVLRRGDLRDAASRFADVIAGYGAAPAAGTELEGLLPRRRRGRRAGAGAVLLAAAALVTGCGDDDSGGDSAQSDYVAAADAICERIDAEGSELSAQYFGEDFSQQQPSLDEQAQFLRELVAQVERGLADIQDLEGPDDGEALLERVFGEDPFLETARDAIDLADAGDLEGFEAATAELFGEAGDPDPELVDEAREYGFDSCVPTSEEDGDDDHE